MILAESIDLHMYQIIYTYHSHFDDVLIGSSKLLQLIFPQRQTLLNFECIKMTKSITKDIIVLKLRKNVAEYYLSPHKILQYYYIVKCRKSFIL